MRGEAELGRSQTSLENNPDPEPFLLSSALEKELQRDEWRKKEED